MYTTILRRFATNCADEIFPRIFFLTLISFRLPKKVKRKLYSNVQFCSPGGKVANWFCTFASNSYPLREVSVNVLRETKPCGKRHK